MRGSSARQRRSRRGTPPESATLYRFTIASPDHTAFQSAPSLSPDGWFLAAALIAGGSRSLWVRPLGALQFRQIAGTEDAQLPFWSPDSQEIAFSSDGRLKKVHLAGGPPQTIYADDWSRDGRTLLYTVVDPKTRGDLWMLPLAGERTLAPYVVTPFSESQGQFSPDGTLVAYTSDETGSPEVYVQPVPPSGAKWPISSGGGSAPRWRADGREIFYVAPDRKLMAMDVRIPPTFEPGVPRPLFEVSFDTPGRIPVDVLPYVVAGDGQRFLMSRVTEASAAAPIPIVLDWMAALK
ncbi:MAG: hypothetical protein ACT4QD_25075 [Acidobacteriota bacterium]